MKRRLLNSEDKSYQLIKNRGDKDGNTRQLMNVDSKLMLEGCSVISVIAAF